MIKRFTDLSIKLHAFIRERVSAGINKTLRDTLDNMYISATNEMCAFERFSCITGQQTLDEH